MTIDSVPITKLATYDNVNSVVRVPSSQISGSVQLNIKPNPRARVISGGVPIEKGGTSSTDELLLKNQNGVELPAQFDVITNWPDGSIKSVLVTAKITADINNTIIHSLDYGAGVSHATYTTNLSYSQTATELTVLTGKCKVVIDKVTGLVKSGWADTVGDLSYTKQVLGQAYITSKDGLTAVNYSSTNETAAEIDVLRSGPYQIMVRAVGYLRDVSNNTYTQYRIWYTFFADSENFDIDYTMVDLTDTVNPITNYAIANLDPMKFSCENLHMVFPHLITSSPKYIFGGENNNSTGNLTAETFIHQTGFMSCNINGAFSLNPDAYMMSDNYPQERYDNTGTGFIYNGVQAGEKAKGFCTVHDSNSGVSAIFKNFWKEWPNELNIDTSNLTIGLHPQRHSDNEGGVRNAFSFVGGFWKWPTTLYHQEYGVAKTFNLTICIHSSLPSAAEVENIRNDRQQDLPHFQSTTDHYCSTKIFGNIIPNNADSALYNQTILDNQRRRSLTHFNFRNQGHFWRYYGGRMRVRASGGSPKFPMSINGSHLGEWTLLNYWFTSGEQEWYDVAFPAAKHFMDLLVNHGGVIGRYSQFPDFPHGSCRTGKHEAADLNWPTDLDSHLHQSCLHEMYILHGTPRILEVLTELADYQAARMALKCPIPRPLEGVSGINLPFGARPLVEIERDYCWNLHVMNRYVKASNNADYHNTYCKQFIQFMIEWWKDKKDHKIVGQVVSYSDWEAGTGYWLMDQSDNEPTKTSNFGCPWIAPHMLGAILEWYDNEVDYGNTTGIDLQEVRHMLYQAVQYFQVWGWNASTNEYLHVIHLTSGSNPDGARQWCGVMARIYLMLKDDLAANNIANPEWYDTATWRERLMLFYERYKTTPNKLASEGLYGYEPLFAEIFWTYAPIIAAEGV